MKAFVVFVFNGEKPSGGWDDVLKKDGLVLSFDTQEEAVMAARTCLWLSIRRKYQVVNIRTGELIGAGGIMTGRKPFRW